MSGQQKKTFWLINQYASTPQTGMGGRHYYLARELVKLGYTVYLISGSFGHKLRERANQKQLVTQTEIEGFTHVKLRVLTYSNSFSKKRVLNWFIFAFLLGFHVCNKLPRPDVIIYSSPALIGYLGAKRLARTLNVPLIFEVRDIWPMTLVKLGGYSEAHPFIRFMQWIEDKAYRESDWIISNLKNAVEHMAKRGLNPDKFFWIPNGFSLDETANPEPLADNVRSKLPADKFFVGYTGTFGVANALDTLIEAADLLRNEDSIIFVLVGTGREKIRLQRMIKEKKLDNVLLLDPIPKTQIQSMLFFFNVCFIGWRNEPLYKFGIGANKIPEYLLSGRPILHAYSGNCDPVAEAGAGLTVQADNPAAIARAVLALKNMPEAQQKIMGLQGYKYAMRELEYGILARKFAAVVTS